MRQSTAIKVPITEVVQCWDASMLGEGTDAILHTINEPGNWHEVFHVQTEKVHFPPAQLYIVAAAMMKSWLQYDAPTAVRCDNGPAFVGELIQVLRNVFGVKIRLIQSRQAYQNGKIERYHHPEAPRPISAADVATISTTIRQEALLHHHQYQNTYDGKGIVRDSHIRVGDLVTVRIPDATRATKTKSKVLGFTKSHPYLCIGLVGKAVRLKDALHGTPMEKPIPRTQCHIFRRALDSSLVQMEATLVQMKPDIEEAFAQNELRYSLLKEKLANRPDAPVCTSCKKPTDRYYALRMCHPCYSKHAYQRLKSKGKGKAPASEAAT
ncbi:hypothetical protein CYMTET_37698 [Cymbomonas tetramitiformis]|uniref:Integrase catalytic domain-containing protein n=1 Tax=Cymbomonas tetramitiformis TaxID=36881 RepID=A0AAE0CF05_9CHLO|nr:hypothetical protein CYMTET_37698 [Cymbomonas tetramitiformis]